MYRPRLARCAIWVVEGQTRGLAGSIMSVAILDSERIRSYFRRASLWERVWRGYPRGSDDGEIIGVWLQVLGATSLIGLSSDMPPLQPFGSAPVAGAQKFYAPRANTQSI